MMIAVSIFNDIILVNKCSLFAGDCIMKKVVCALATLAFIGSINVVSADDLLRFRLMVIRFMISLMVIEMSFLVQIDLEVAL